MDVFEEMRHGKAYDIRDAAYQAQVHGEIDRCTHLCQEISLCDSRRKDEILAKERALLAGRLEEGTYLTPPLMIDCGSRVFLGRNVFANHHLTGTITIEDGVMLGPEVGLFTVNHEPRNIRTIMTKEIHIKKNDKDRYYAIKELTMTDSEGAAALYEKRVDYTKKHRTKYRQKASAAK